MKISKAFDVIFSEAVTIAATIFLSIAAVFCFRPSVSPFLGGVASGAFILLIAFWNNLRTKYIATLIKNELTPIPPENPNHTVSDLRWDVLNYGFKMFRNSNDYWDISGKPERWTGPLVCWGMDHNKLVYNTTAGDFTMVRDCTPEETARFAREVLRTDGLFDLLKTIKED